MSYTEIFTFDKKGNASQYGEVKNAFRGAMQVWNLLDFKYLPPFIPTWALNLPVREERYHRSSDFMGGGLKEVWSLFDNPDISETDKIVLGTTFDNVVVMKENLQSVIDAFRAFEGETSLKEQADILEEALNDEDVIAVAWNQTSVNGGAWETGDVFYDEDGDEQLVPYNLSGDKHWDLFNEKVEE